MNKLAPIGFAFWILKILATTLGETAGDLLSMTLDLGYVRSLLLTGTVLALLLLVQVRARRYHALLFWAAIIGTTTVGTEISDMLDRTLALGYLWGSLLLVGLLVAVLVVWYRALGTLRVEPLVGRRAEVFFWLAVLCSNGLGTAFGDFLTDDLALSYMQGALICSGVIGAVLLLHYATRINAVLLFWAAFIFTRPFGATFGDWLTKPVERGGLDLGTAQASLVTLAVFLAVLWVARKRTSPRAFSS